MAKFHVKRGDEVVIMSGTERGQRGKILKVITKNGRVIIEGRKLIKRHTRKNQQHPNGAIVEREGSIHASNVILASIYDQKVAQRSGTATEPTS